MRLQHLRPDQLQTALDERWPLLLPTGCIEYHGPHLPLGVDTIVVEELMLAVAERVRCVVAPPIWYGPASHAVTGPRQGSLDVSTERFGRHVKDILAGFCDMGWHWIIVGVHHQGLEGPESLAIRQAAAEVMFEQAQAERGDGWWGKAPPDPNDNVFERIQVWPSVLPAAAEQGVEMADHAGYYETSFILATHPDLVAQDRLGMKPPWYANTPQSKAREATPASARRLWAAMVQAWVERLSAIARPKRPPPSQTVVRGLF
ncbi:MAG: creatininase family protein [Caldilineae bacterium]|nr:MAG: creatininase family protein [Caldilineae bacterium]